MPKIEHGPECWMVGKKVAVLYDDGKWYPESIFGEDEGDGSGEWTPQSEAASIP